MLSSGWIAALLLYLIFFFQMLNNRCVSACSAQTAVALQIFRLWTFFFLINRR